MQPYGKLGSEAHTLQLCIYYEEIINSKSDIISIFFFNGHVEIYIKNNGFLPKKGWPSRYIKHDSCI